ncbi:2'-5' RNA ligase family protein [Amycolatopsis sp. lyj-109]|uniref:2'-5' RNA ligase family protein n=1 Tax=Amycolatopsis sp. lyj-109 TaxID=2789287 RepID=UPI00397B9772
MGDLKAAVAETGAFECVFSRVAWFGQEVVWLAADSAEPFRALTERVWRRFPEYPPYGGEHPDVMPHLTIGSTRRAGAAALKRAATEVGAKLPIRVRIDRVRLIAGATSPDSWRTVAEWRANSSASG